MNKKKILIVLLIIILILMLLGGFIFIKNKRNNNNKYGDNYLTIKDEQLEVCNNNDCRYSFSNYKNFELSLFKSNNYKNELSNFNNIINNLKNDQIKSKQLIEECPSIKNSYKYRNYLSNTYDIYTSDSLISIVFKNDIIDLCNETVQDSDIYTLYYDVINDKTISKEDIYNLYNVKNEDLIYSIDNSLDNVNEIFNTSYMFENVDMNSIIPFIDSNGELYVYYKVKESIEYYDAKLSMIVNTMENSENVNN